MKYLLTIFLSLFIFSAHSKNNCSDEDYADSRRNWGNFSSEDHYEFNIKLKKAFKEKNLKLLMSLMVEEDYENELIKKNIDKINFEELLEKSLIKNVIKEEINCYAHYLNGFMVSQGSLWYQYDAELNKFYISYLSFNNKVINSIDIGVNSNGTYLDYVEWIHNEKIINPSCFSYYWIGSGDNYEEYEEKFGISSDSDFFKFPGKYFGKEISLKKERELMGQSPRSLSRNLEMCNKPEDKTEIEDGYVRFKGKEFNSYKLVKKISNSNCKKLAPNIKGKCLSSYLVNYNIDDGGSRIDSGVYYHIYGIFKLDDAKEYLFPLVNLWNKNKALYFLETLDTN